MYTSDACTKASPTVVSNQRRKALHLQCPVQFPCQWLHLTFLGEQSSCCTRGLDFVNIPWKRTQAKHVLSQVAWLLLEQSSCCCEIRKIGTYHSRSPISWYNSFGTRLHSLHCPHSTHIVLCERFWSAPGCFITCAGACGSRPLASSSNIVVMSHTHARSARGSARKYTAQHGSDLTVCPAKSSAKHSRASIHVALNYAIIAAPRALPVDGSLLKHVKFLSLSLSLAIYGTCDQTCCLAKIKISSFSCCSCWSLNHLNSVLHMHQSTGRAYIGHHGPDKVRCLDLREHMHPQTVC